MTSLDIAAAAVRLYAESHPRPPHVTQSQAGEMLGRGSKPITVEQHEKAQANANAKRYIKGKLPDWMYS